MSSVTRRSSSRSASGGGVDSINVSFDEPRNLVGGEWHAGSGESLEVFDPATGAVLTHGHQATQSDVNDVVAAAFAAFTSWSAKPIGERAEYLRRMKAVLVENGSSIAELLTLDSGKTLGDARGEVLRSAEFIDAAISAPMVFRGDNVLDVSRGVDSEMFRQALGVCVAITPFNFPVLNPTIFVAWSLICGNTIVVKPSEQDPLVSTRLFQIFAKADLPPGVVNVLHGGASVAQMLVAHRDVAAVSAIGSSSAAAGVYATAAAAGKRVQASGGASNPIVVMPDADVPYAVQSVLQAAFGMAGQRCLGASRLYTVGRIHDEVLDRLRLSAIKYVVGSGFDADTDVCPLISSQSKAAVERAIKLAVGSGAAPILDGRGALPSNQDLADGYFVGPTILDGPTDGRQPATDEVFGPVLRVFNVASLDEAISACNATDFGNAASIFTESGRAAREFKVRCAAGNIGINLGLAAPTPPFTMGGTGASFYGDLHPSGATMIDFYTDIKQVSSRWT